MPNAGEYCHYVLRGGASPARVGRGFQRVMEDIELSNEQLLVTISPLGAELQSVLDSSGREWLWQADPAYWNRHAPILFPLVGRAVDNKVRYRGHDYPISQHGFARDRAFTVVARSETGCTLRLSADDATRQIYPFEFELDIAYALDGTRLRETVTVRNKGGDVLPASVGFHPGFAWPLPGVEAPQNQHVVLFERDETAPIRRIAGGLMMEAGQPNPVVGRRLALDPSLFVNDALIFDAPASRSVWFGVEGHPGLRVDFPDLPFLGIWTKPGAPFLCIEPWQGHTAPQGFAGEIGDMPGMMHIAPGGEASRHIAIEIGAPAP